MDSPIKNTEVGCHFLLQEVFPTRDWTQVSIIAGRFFTYLATSEDHGVAKSQTWLNTWTTMMIYTWNQYGILSQLYVNKK